MTQVSTKRLAGIPLLWDLDDIARGRFAAHTSAKKFPSGEALIRQGGAPDGAYFIEKGEVDVVIKLPGGGEVAVATLGRGALVGEIALVHDSHRTATVRAKSPVSVIFFDKRYFRAACEQLEPIALDVLRRVGIILSQRLRTLTERTAAVLATDHSIAPSPPPASPTMPSRRDGAAFDVGAFLPRLPHLQNFGAGALAQLAKNCTLFEADRGYLLYPEGDTAKSCTIVARGAVESVVWREERKHQLSILGPGEIAGVYAVLDQRQHAMSYQVREDATLLDLSAAAFDELVAGKTRLSLALLNAANQSLAIALRRADSRLTRLVGLARMSEQFDQRVGVIT